MAMHFKAGMPSVNNRRNGTRYAVYFGVALSTYLTYSDERFLHRERLGKEH